MFGKEKNVQITSQLCRKSVSAFLLLSFAVISLTSIVNAAGDNSKTIKKNAAKSKNTASLKLDGFQAETFSGATKLSWRTGFEQNILGFKLWRDDQGQRVLVNENLVTGSLLQVRNGILPAGGEYKFFDHTDSTNVQYWLEAIDINSQSRWFGPVFPQMGFAKSETADESGTDAALTNNPGSRRQQFDKVDFLTPVLKKNKNQKLQSSENNLIANDPDALKIEVRNRGIYRVDAQSLAENGFNSVESANWKLFAGGVEQPIVVNADGSIEFFGQGIDTYETDANVYWLMTDTTGGRRINRTPQSYLSSANYGWTRVIAERKDKIYRINSILNGAHENWYGTVINGTASNQTLALSDIATDSGQTATVGIDLQGLTEVEHNVTVLLNGAPIGQIDFFLYDLTQWSANVPLSRLVEGTNTITLQAIGGSSDINITEAVRISYPRRLKAQNDRLDFSVSAGQRVKLKGFTNPQIRVFDVTNPVQVTEFAPESLLETDGTYSVTVASATSGRVMLAQGVNAPLLAAAPLIRNRSSNLRNTQNQAKFIIIAPYEFHKSLYDFQYLRRLQGIQTEIVDVQDIYDEFNNGIQSVESIHEFLRYAKQNWAVKPDFVMLVGDGSVDPRNYSGFGGDAYNKVPTMLTDTWNMETVSDEMLVDFDDDSVGEMAIGRLPAKDRGELESMLDKVIGSEPMTSGELSGRGITFVSDDSIGYDFAAGSRNMASVFPPGVNVNYIDRTTQDPELLRNEIVGRINEGAAIVNYFGHGYTGAWTGAQILRNIDAPRLTNPKRTPLMVMVDCLNGDFAEPNAVSIGEAMMQRGSGGANAVWASSGWNTADIQEIFIKDFYEKVFAGMPLGEAARQTKMLYEINDLRRTYIFFGDPTQKLVIP